MTLTENGEFEILLIEDNPGDAKLVERNIRRIDPVLLPVETDLRHVETLDDGLTALGSDDVDLVLLDLGLPESSGLESLRAVVGETDVPVVVLTGHYDETELAIQAIREGAQDYLDKNRISVENLGRAIRYAFEREKHKEKLRERTEQLELLTRIVQHDIRNDLSVINGWIGLLEGREDLDEEVRARLDRIQAVTEHGVEITDTASVFVEFLGTDEGPELGAVSLASVLSEEVGKARSTYGDATFVVEDVPAVEVTADRMLSSVFRNLLSNAVQHNDADTPRVEVSATESDDGVTVAVADNGPGVPDGQKTDVFGKGERGMESPGTGIGLHLVHTLVDSYGGEVWVEDGHLGGAAFKIRLQKAG